MIHFCSEELLKEVCDSDAGHNLPTILVEITATVLDQEVGRKKILSFYETSAKKGVMLIDSTYFLITKPKVFIASVTTCDV